MKVTIISIVIGAFGTVTKELVQGREDLDIRGWVETKLLLYWDRTEYWEESRRFEETCCHSNSSENSSANAGVKNTQRVKIIRKIKVLWLCKIMWSLLFKNSHQLTIGFLLHIRTISLLWCCLRRFVPVSNGFCLTISSHPKLFVFMLAKRQKLKFKNLWNSRQRSLQWKSFIFFTQPFCFRIGIRKPLRVVFKIYYSLRATN